jgi:two-component system sensor histidine kinase DegS
MNDSKDGPTHANVMATALVPHGAADALAGAAYQKFDALELELQLLLAEMTIAVDQARHERAQALHFAGHYGVGWGPSVGDKAATAAPLDARVQTGVHIAVENVRASLQAMSDELAKRTLLYEKVRLALSTTQDLRRQFSPESWADPIEPLPASQIGPAIATAREDERRRVARELHDGPAQILANAVFSVEMAEHIATRSPELVPEELDRLRDVLKLGMAEVRRLMFDLRPSSLDDLGLVETINRYVLEYNHFFGKDVELSLPEQLPPLTPDETVSIFRVVQESLQNVQKHAQTNAAPVSLTWSPPRLTVAIVDHGRGFRPEAFLGANYDGAGVRGMQERAELIGGVLEIASEPGIGTSVQLHLDLSSRTAGNSLSVES